MFLKTIGRKLKPLMVAGGLLLAAAPAMADTIAALHEALPQQYRDNGVNIAVFNDWPPDEFLENGVLKGWSVDLAKEIEKRLGVTFTYHSTSFDAIIPGLVARRFDAGFASFGSTPERLKALDFISQRKIGTAFGLKADSTLDISSEEDVCGVAVAVMAGSWDNDLIDELNKRACVEKGLPEVRIQQYSNQAQAELAVKSGRAEATLASSAKLGYLVRQSGEFRLAELVLNPVNSCIGVRKGDPLGKVISDAIQTMIDDGTYEKIMADWGLDDSGMLTQALLITEENLDF